MYPGVTFFNLKKLRNEIEYDLPVGTLGITNLVKKYSHTKNKGEKSCLKIYLTLLKRFMMLYFLIPYRLLN
jgi:hypothetical protein